MFLIGVQYYRPPTPLSEDWERDLRNIRESGMNIIRGWMTWGWLNPAPGKYDFSEVRRLLDLCEKNKLKVIMLISLEGAPNWVIREHPEAMYVSQSGLPRFPGAGSNTPSGGFPGLCLDHQVVRDLASEYIANLVREFAGHKSLYCWEPHNEPMMEGARYRDEIYCYCEESIKRFREWLKAKYKSLDNLCSIWRYKYSDWEEIFPPRERGGIWIDWVDWRNFTLDNITEHLKWRKKVIVDNDSHHLVMLHGRGYGTILQDTLVECIDDWRFAKTVEVYGQAVFPGRWGAGHNSKERDVVYRLHLEGTRSIAKEKDWWQSELQAGEMGFGLSHFPVISAQQLDYWSWVSIAYGAKAILYWQYRQERAGFEYGYGLTRLDGTLSEKTEMVKKISKILQKYEDFFNKAIVPHPEIGIVYSINNQLLHGLAEGKPLFLMNSSKGLYEALSSLDYSVEVVRGDEEAVDDDYTPYKVIYLPCPTWISPKTAEKLKSFVREGGTLISEASLAVYDGEFLACLKVPGLGLDEVFAVERDMIENIGNPSFSNPGIAWTSRLSTASETESIKYKGTGIPTRYYKEYLSPKGAEVIGRFTDGRPAITRNRYGNGLAIYIASNPFMEYHYSRSPSFLRFIEEIQGNLEREAKTDNISTYTRTLISGSKKMVFLFNNSESQEVIKTRLSVFKEKRIPGEIAKNERVKVKEVGPNLEIEVSLSQYEKRVYLFE